MPSVGIIVGVELGVAAFGVASRHYLATYETALRFSPQIVMRGYRDSFVMLAGTWGGKGDVRCGQEHQARNLRFGRAQSTFAGGHGSPPFFR